MKTLAFHVRGTLVEVHASILLLFTYLLYQGWELGLPAWHITTSCVILVGTVLVHELAHVMAFGSALGVRSRVWIFAVGGVTVPTEPLPSGTWWRMALVAFAGPASNLLLALLCGVLMASAADWVTLELALTALVINLSLGVFNLIPSRPFDGGHVFAALLEWLIGPGRITEFALGFVGVVCGLCLLAGALYLHDPFLALGGLTAIYANTPLSRLGDR